MEYSHIVQIGIGALIVLIVLFMLLENISIPRKLAEARLRNDSPSTSDPVDPRR